MALYLELGWPSALSQMQVSVNLTERTQRPSPMMQDTQSPSVMEERPLQGSGVERTVIKSLLGIRPGTRPVPVSCHMILVTTPRQTLGFSSFHRCKNEGLERLHFCPRSHTTNKWQRQQLDSCTYTFQPVLFCLTQVRILTQVCDGRSRHINSTNICPILTTGKALLLL